MIHDKEQFIYEFIFKCYLIIYILKILFKAEEVEVIRKAIKFWPDNTCLEFIEQPRDPVPDYEHLVITKSLESEET